MKEIESIRKGERNDYEKMIEIKKQIREGI